MRKMENLFYIRNLAQRIKRSDANAFKELFDYYQKGIFNFLYFKLGSVEAAEDILQDAFVKLWENRQQLREEVSIKSYLFTIANNLALNHLRHTKIVLKFQLEQKRESPKEETPYRELEKNELNNSLLEAIENLPEKPRVAFMLSRFEDLTYKEVAERLGISVKTVESHIGRALKLLREALSVVA